MINHYLNCNLTRGLNTNNCIILGGIELLVENILAYDKVNLIIQENTKRLYLNLQSIDSPGNKFTIISMPS